MNEFLKSIPDIDLIDLYPRTYTLRNKGGPGKRINPFGTKGRRYYQWLVNLNKS